VLAAQNARYGDSPARERNLAHLAEGAAAVVTGQQVGLFLGPLFTTYKTATAIVLARRLSKERGRPVVPVFWLQTEDHDLAEIATCDIAPSRGAALRVDLPVSGEHVSVAHRTLPGEIASRLSELEAALAHLPHANEHLGRLRRHYRPGATWGEAFAGVLAELFAEEGLVLLDPRDPRFAPLSAPVHRRAVEEAIPIAEALRRMPPVVHVREASPLSFYHPDGPEGPRYRLVRVEGGFVEAGGGRVHTDEEIFTALDERPMCFSTSALLRPVLQDTWLSTTAYVAGPAEAQYFAQLPPLYAAFGREMPRVVPRARMRLLEAKTRKTLGELRLSAQDVSASEEETLARAFAAAGEAAGADELRTRLLHDFTRSLDELSPTLRAAGEGMDRAIEKTRGTVEHAVARLTEHYAKAARHRDHDRVDRVKRLVEWLVPHGKPQERVFGISYFAARHGERAFLEKVLEAADGASDRTVDLSL